jgi:hypothetical protein
MCLELKGVLTDGSQLSRKVDEELWPAEVWEPASRSRADMGLIAIRTPFLATYSNGKEKGVVVALKYYQALYIPAPF